MILSSPTAQGSGKLTGAFESCDGTILAISSSWPLLTEPAGRAAYCGQRLRERLALHRRGEARPFAVFDAAQWPIHWADFHPADPVVAIATGAYDGGYEFEGEVWLWDWDAGKSWQLTAQSPEVNWCRFTPDGKRLDIMTRPWHEEWPGDGDCAWLAEWGQQDDDRYYPASLPYTSSAGEPIDIIIDPLQAVASENLSWTKPDPDGRTRQIRDWLHVGTLKTCGAIWDVAWLDDRRIAAVHNECRVEIHDIASGQVSRFPGNGDYGGDILRTSPPIIVTHRDRWQSPRSHLLALSEAGLTELAAFDGVYTYSSATNGQILGRLDRNLKRQGGSDIMLDTAGGTIRRTDVGHYDVFNHFLGIDGAPEVFLLLGTPASSHKDKRLCRLRADGTTETLWHLLPDDGTPASHAMECLGCYVDDSVGAGIVLSGRHYDPNPLRASCGFIFRRPLAGRGAEDDMWRIDTHAAVSAMLHEPATDVIVAAFLDGTLSVLRAADGVVEVSGPVTIDNIATVIYSVDVRGSLLAIGTFDGRIAVLPLASLIERGLAGPIELA